MISNIDSMIKWASGFVDGEGYLQYKQEPYKRIRMEVCNTDFRPIEVLQEIFGGKVYYRKPRVTAKGTITKPQKMWVVLNEECYEACKSLLPFLITSKKIDVAKQTDTTGLWDTTKGFIIKKKDIEQIDSNVVEFKPKETWVEGYKKWKEENND